MSYDDFTYLAVTVDDGIADVVLNRPDKHNAFTAEGHREMAELYPRLAADADVRAVLVTGAGRSFCAGPDRALLSALSDPSADDLRNGIMQETFDLVHRAIDFDKPVVTAIHGVAAGMGLAFAMLADIIVVERQVSFREGHVLAALTAGDGGTLLWPAAMGLVKAKRYLLTSDPVTADEAERMGLITEVVDTGSSRQRAATYARRLADGPQYAIRTTKRALNQWLKVAAPAVFDVAWALETISMAHPDAAAAARSLGAGEGGAIAPDS